MHTPCTIGRRPTALPVNSPAVGHLGPVVFLLAAWAMQCCALDSTELRNTYDATIAPFFISAGEDSTGFGKFEEYLDSLAVPDRYAAFDIVRRSMVDSCAEKANVDQLEYILLHKFFGLYLRFWNPYYYTDPAFLRYATAKVTILDTAKFGFPYFFYYDTPYFTRRSITRQLGDLTLVDESNRAEFALFTCAAFVDSVATFVQSSRAYPDVYREDLCWMSFLVEILEGEEVTEPSDWEISVKREDPGVELVNVSQSSDGTMYICGSAGFVASSSDNGLSWVRWPETFGDSTIAKVAFANDTVGYALTSGDGDGTPVFKGKLYETTDGGETWRVPVPFQEMGCNDFVVIDTTTVVVTSRDEVWTSRPGESGWTGRPAGGLGLYNMGGGIVFSYEPGLHVSHDFGHSWTTLAENPWEEYGLSVRGIRFFDENRGLAFGHRGALFLSTDGGRSWSRVFIPFAGEIVTVNILDDMTAVALGEPFAFFVTEDGGATWSYDSLLLFRSVTAGCVTNRGELWYTTKRGAVFVLTNAAVFRREQDPGNPGLTFPSERAVSATFPPRHLPLGSYMLRLDGRRVVQPAHGVFIIAGLKGAGYRRTVRF